MCVRKIDNLVYSGDPLAAVRNPIVAEHHEESGEVSISDKVVPLSAQWISEELLLETRKLWSKAYKRVISIDEAIEILMNVKQVAEVLVKMQKRNNSL